ncbi:PAS domain S-box protein [Chondrinema litorale]|uniref:PAS domain S-box protein n=1 Tax=Chondrinema litorale TaxID=2994555 RepID=UPI0025435A1A|nr:PAS domain S-box protein [Chondrinema litorale]UZR92949.1 PAS domain S-box protein [Chondrinema litorale]
MKLSARLYFLFLFFILLSIASFFTYRIKLNQLQKIEHLYLLVQKQQLLCELINRGTENFIFNKSSYTAEKVKDDMLSLQQNMIALRNSVEISLIEDNLIKEIDHNWSFTVKHILNIISDSKAYQKQELREITLLTDRIKTDFKLITGSLQTKQLRLKSEIKFTNYIVFILFLITGIGGIVLIYFAVQKPLIKISTIAKNIALGDLTYQTKFNSKDELGSIGNALNQTINRQLEIREIARKLGEGDFNIDYKIQGENDSIGKSLIEMKDKIQTFFENDRKRNWLNTGLASFSELLQKWNNNLEVLSEKIIIQLAEFLNANQGAIFIINEEDDETPFMELKAAYAWNKKKHLNKRIKIGEGLLGQVATEGESKYITEIPEDYINITSGMGAAKPRSILMVPLKFNDVIEGIIELAFFQKVEKHEIEFVEKLAENVASAVHTINANSNTHKLLKESIELTDQMSHQEELMRNNMIELQATQDKIQQKEAELSGLFVSINNTLATVEYNMDGSIEKVNKNLLKILGYNYRDLKGKTDHFFILNGKDDRFWRDLNIGKSKSGDFEWKTKNDQSVWLNSTYTPITDKRGKPYKVLQFSQDITAKKHAEIEAYRLSLVADNTDNSVIITDKYGRIEYANKGFERLTGYTLREVAGKKPGSVLQGPETNQITIDSIRKSIRRQEPSYNEILNYDKNGKSYWVSIAINPVFNKMGQLDKFISIQANITKIKREALDQSYKMKAIGNSNIIVEFDLSGKPISANKKYLEIMEFSFHEISEVPLEYSFNNNTEQSSFNTFWKTLLQVKFTECDFKQKSSSGKWIWFRGSFNVVHDLTGEPIKVLKIAQDITHEKELEIAAQIQSQQLEDYTKELESFQETLSKKLQEARAEMKMQMDEIENEKIKNVSILESCIDAVITFNQLGFIEFFNVSAEKLFIQERINVIGSTIDQLLPLTVKNENQDFLIYNTKTDKPIPVNKKFPISLTINQKIISTNIAVNKIKIGKYYFFTIFLHI